MSIKGYRIKTKKERSAGVSKKWIENEAAYSAGTFSGLALESSRLMTGPLEEVVKFYLRGVLPARYPQLSTKEFEALLARTAALIVDYSARVERA